MDLLAVQGTLKSLFQHHSSKAPILWCSAFFTVQLSHPYMTTGKTIALTAAAAAAKSFQSCPTVRPQRWQPTRLPRPWDSPSKNTGVDCHFLLRRSKWERPGVVCGAGCLLDPVLNCSDALFILHIILQK